MSLAAPGDPRPAVWVGHIAMGVSDVAESKAFFLKLGMRDVEPDAPVAILELRAGTHLIVLPTETPPAPGTPAPFDLMVDDVEYAHAFCLESDLSPSELKEEQFHRSFTVREPGGHDVKINSSHASGLPV